MLDARSADGSVQGPLDQGHQADALSALPGPQRRSKGAEGLRSPEGQKDQPIDVPFARKMGQVIQEWSDRYGDKVAGWWFDGGYKWVGFNEEIAQIYATAVSTAIPRPSSRSTPASA